MTSEQIPEIVTPELIKQLVSKKNRAHSDQMKQLVTKKTRTRSENVYSSLPALRQSKHLEDLVRQQARAGVRFKKLDDLGLK